VRHRRLPERPRYAAGLPLCTAILPGGEKDTLVWKWGKGVATTSEELADPQSTAHYFLCIYAGPSNQLVGQVHVPPSEKWREVGTSFRYRDTTGAADGAQSLSLKSGGETKTKVLFKGRGDGLPDLLDLGSLSTPVWIQLINYETGVCFDARYEMPRRNDEGVFLAKETALIERP
jgi:hypothetical protein